MWQIPQETAYLVTFTKKILNGKLQFLCNVNCILSPVPNKKILSSSIIQSVCKNSFLFDVIWYLCGMLKNVSFSSGIGNNTLTRCHCLQIVRPMYVVDGKCGAMFSFLFSILWDVILLVLSVVVSALLGSRYHCIYFFWFRGWVCLLIISMNCISRKVSVFGVFLVRVFPHLDWIRENRTKKTPNTDTFYTVFITKCFYFWCLF